jgi:hypothetical protein
MICCDSAIQRDGTVPYWPTTTYPIQLLGERFAYTLSMWILAHTLANMSLKCMQSYWARMTKPIGLHYSGIIA